MMHTVNRKLRAFKMIKMMVLFIYLFIYLVFEMVLKSIKFFEIKFTLFSEEKYYLIPRKTKVSCLGNNDIYIKRNFPTF